jgi:Leucine-rich repeat (LRR) protein
LVHLAEVSAPRNKLAGIPAEVSHLPALKKLDLSANVIVSVPGELATSAKLKELVLIDNPLKDNRLKKLVAQKGTKAVLDYIGQHCPKVNLFLAPLC